MYKVRHGIFLVLVCVLFYDCNNCSKFENEQYSESDTLSLHSPGLWILKKYYDDLDIPELNQPKQEAYRMFYRRAFDEYEHIIWLTKTPNGCSLKSIDINSVFADNEWNTVAIDTLIKELPMTKWNEFENLLYKANYWTLPQKEGDSGLDGQTFLLEGYRPEALKCDKRVYHLIIRWSPEPGPLRNLCDSILSYANLLK